jgi:hypothetical protein
MQEIFISYRRDDSQDATGRIHDWLDNYFGESATFRDIDRIRGGSHFPAVLQEALDRCKVVLAVIGQKWATIADEADFCTEQGSLPIFQFVNSSEDVDSLYQRLLTDAETVFENASPLKEADFDPMSETANNA